MADMKKIAKHLIQMEAVRDGEHHAETSGTIDWWADLVIEILDDLPPGTTPRIAQLVVDYIVGVEDGA